MRNYFLGIFDSRPQIDRILFDKDFRWKILGLNSTSAIIRFDNNYYF